MYCMTYKDTAWAHIEQVAGKSIILFRKYSAFSNVIFMFINPLDILTALRFFAYREHSHKPTTSMRSASARGYRLSSIEYNDVAMMNTQCHPLQ